MTLTVASRARQYLIASVILCCVAPYSVAATATLTLVSPGTNAPFTTDGTPTGLSVYVGPYVVSINGVDVNAICLDYQYDAPGTSPDSTPWDVTNVVAGSDTILLEQAYLAQQLLNPPGACDPTYCAAPIQYAIWELTAPQDVPFATHLATITDSVFQTAVSNYIVAASSAANYDPANYPPGTYPNVEVYTANTGEVQSGLQRFMTVTTPEPPFLSVLGVDFSAVGALIFLFRRRTAA